MAGFGPPNVRGEGETNRPRRRKPRNRNAASAGTVRPIGRRLWASLAQTAGIGDPAAPPALAGAAQCGVRAGRDGPASGLQPYRPPSRDRPPRQADGRTAKKDALRRCITTMGHRHVRVRQRADRYAHRAPMQGKMCPPAPVPSRPPRSVRGLRRRLFAPGTRAPDPARHGLVALALPTGKHLSSEPGKVTANDGKKAIFGVPAHCVSQPHRGFSPPFRRYSG